MIGWHKSTRSADTNCVEVAVDARRVLVRDSKRPGGPVLAFTRRDWTAFLRSLRGSSLGVRGASGEGRSSSGEGRSSSGVGR